MHADSGGVSEGFRGWVLNARAGRAACSSSNCGRKDVSIYRWNRGSSRTCIQRRPATAVVCVKFCKW